MNKHIKLFSIGFLALMLFLASFNDVLAQNVVSTTQLPAQNQNCVNLSYNMRFGNRDYATNGDVSRLQTYLNINGYLSVSATGYFGPMTLSAMQNFQSNNGLYSAGYAGPLTRSKISQLSCGINQSSVPVVYSLSPSSGVVGTNVTISGSNFTSDSKVLFDTGSAGNVVVNGNNSITITIPSAINPPCYYSTPPCLLFAASRMVTPGNYSISVQNSNGTSNKVTFNVTSGTQNNQPVVNGLDSPTSLNVDQTGTWNIRATDVTGGGLNYSVVWGDEVYAVTNTSSAVSNTFVQSSTFNHTYHSAGTFTPVFTIRGSNGQSVQTSASVTVSVSSNYQIPNITSVSPVSGTIGTSVLIRGSGFGIGNTVLFGGGPVTNNLVWLSDSGTNNTALSFTVPNSVGSDCPAQGNYNVMCPMYARLITPGIYNVVVRNQNGTSNSVSYTVTSY